MSFISTAFLSYFCCCFKKQKSKLFGKETIYSVCLCLRSTKACKDFHSNSSSMKTKLNRVHKKLRAPQRESDICDKNGHFRLIVWVAFLSQLTLGL